MKRVKKQPHFFLNLEETRSTQGTDKKIEISKKEIDSSVEITKIL